MIMSWNEQREGETTPQWLTRVLGDERSNRAIIEHVRARLAEEKRWLRASLEADLLPEWLIEMVMERWGRDPPRILTEYIRPAILDMSLFEPKREEGEEE